MQRDKKNIEEWIIKDDYLVFFFFKCFFRERLKFSRRAVSDDNEEIDDYLKV